ncbi:hypothetical protein OG976_20960 [Mycobacterium sp. NBC_00419]|uniref:hypothetical protein n=1 Tax=Mycobacterium sp. NBC_00419 TaxID=2975989 RepID=UPI002E22080A
MTRTTYAVIVLAAVAGLTGTACSNSGSTTTSTTTESATASASAVDKGQLPSLIPTLANTQVTKGPDDIADNGIHLHFQVPGSPADVMNAFKTALAGQKWDLTTIVSSGGSDGGGATYTGNNGAAYGVFDGGGYKDTTYIDVCAWPSKPADPNCTRGGR